MNKIEIENLSMRFGKIEALQDISLTIESNKLYGLLGRNGAGKTTLLNAIDNRIIPTTGTIKIDGQPVLENDHALGKVFYVGEKQLLPEDTKVKDSFRIASRFFPFDLDYANRLAIDFGLQTSKKLKNLSTGYATIAKLIVGLACDVDYLLLDEPVLGLDANHRETFYRRLLESYAARPRTIVISTHLIEEISGLIEQVIILKNGRLLLDVSAEEVRAMGYCVSGKAEDVDAYCADKQVLSEDRLGALKSACLLGKPMELPQTLQRTALDMQKLFVHLTNMEED